MNDRCFAMNARKDCSALIVKVCSGNGRCPFYKSRTQADRDRERAFARLSALPCEAQDSIAEKYYEGKMPWRGEIA